MCWMVATSKPVSVFTSRSHEGAQGGAVSSVGSRWKDEAAVPHGRNAASSDPRSTACRKRTASSSCLRTSACSDYEALTCSSRELESKLEDKKSELAEMRMLVDHYLSAEAQSDAAAQADADAYALAHADEDEDEEEIVAEDGGYRAFIGKIDRYP